MTAVPINYLAVLAGAIMSMPLGFLWYGPLFGKQWMAWSGMDPKAIDKAKAKGMGKSYTIMFIGSLIMSFVLAHSLVFASVYTQTSGVAAGLMVGVWSWLGFIAPVTLGTVLWDGKPWKLWVLNNAYYLILLCVMGVILALWQ